MTAEIHDAESLLSHLSRVIGKDAALGVHLAVFIEPYLRYIKEGKKTVESRFSVRRIAPYQKVFEGDLILLKEASGPIVGSCSAGEVRFYRLNPSTLSEIRKTFEAEICAQPGFWESKESASYATLIRLGKFDPLPPIRFRKRDRRGWIVLRPKNSAIPFKAFQK